MDNKRIFILVGHYGTGKTTIALNLALRWAKDKKIALADLDVNNPYFRSRDWLKYLKENNVQPIIPEEKIAFAEMPYLPKDIYSAINNTEKTLIIDLGGHEIGTKVVGSLADKINKTPYEMWMVVNTYRPETETEKEITDIFYRLQDLSNLKITGLINNTNLATMTELDDILNGEKVVLDVAKSVNVPFIGNAIESSMLNEAKKHIKTPIIPIHRFDLLKWE